LRLTPQISGKFVHAVSVNQQLSFMNDITATIKLIHG
jgi:hypothetical protein